MSKKRGASKKSVGRKSKVSKKISKKGSINISGSKKDKNHSGKYNGNKHPLFTQELTLGQRAADKIAVFGGSWTFITIFGIFLLAWMGVNTWIFFNKGFDPYPYILLNLVLSCLAAIQAPIILMAQNRQAQRDRIDAKYDHQVDRKAEREVQRVLKDLYNLRRMIKALHDEQRKNNK